MDSTDDADPAHPMKICSHCGATYDHRVDFCFADGTPLREATADEVAAAEAAAPPKPRPAPTLGTDLVEPQNLRFDDVPEPKFLQALPPADDDSQDAPALSESPTNPVPLDQAAPFSGALPDVAAPAQPLPSTQDTVPLPEPPLQRGGDWAEDLEADDAGFFASTAPSVGQEAFGGPADQETSPPPPPSVAEDSTDDADSVDLARQTFGGAASWPPATDEPAPARSNKGLALALAAAGMFIVVGGGGVMLWTSSSTSDDPGPVAQVERPEAPTPDVAEASAPPPEAAPTVPAPVVEPEPVTPPADAPDDDPPAEPVAPTRDDARPQTPPTPTATPAPRDNPATVALLSISTDPPGAIVWIDGAKIGPAPVAREVTIGSHTVKAELTGYVTQTVRVSADRGGSTARIPLKAETKSEAMVKLFGQPGSQVFVDGRNVGTLPVSIPLATGSHDFRVVTPNAVSYEVTKKVSASTTSLSLLPD